jgi:hypothetical protein
MKRKALAICLSLMVWPLLGAAPVAEIQAILAKPKVLCGRFDQTKQLAGLKNPLRSSGRFCVVADKGVLWRSLQPFANTLRLTRDEIVQWHGERLAMRLNAKQEPTVQLINALLFSILAGDFGQLEKYFDVEGVAGDGAWSVKLKARDAGVAKVIGAIALDGGAYVKNIAIDEAKGDRTRIVFSAIQTGEQAMTSEEAALF